MATSVKLLSSRHLLPFKPYCSRLLTSRNPNPNRRPRYEPAADGTEVGAGITAFAGGGRRRILFLSQLPTPRRPLFLSISRSFSEIPHDCIGGFAGQTGKGFALWDPAGEIAVDAGGGNLGFSGGKGAIWTVVILGWLGAEKKHLKRYADIYNARGIRSVSFVVPLREIVGLDFGRRMEDKVSRLTEDLVDWCSQSERDGKERNLLFHTFSNTEVSTFCLHSYGSILKNLQSRCDIVEKIKGCVVDSGPAPEISPKVWAAGFCAALMKKRSSAVYPSPESINGDSAKGNGDRAIRQDWKAQILEMLVMFILEKFFSIILILPDVNQRLNTVISILSTKQPRCPQLYLYSSADRVIPVSSVEFFIEEQKAMGRSVCAYDFSTSPHVDHFRSFPQLYSAKVNEFLNECCPQIELALFVHRSWLRCTTFATTSSATTLEAS
ncbi:hypothetical protein AXF42_Ash014220 [Apostasia shenzhenica]|uniref:Transmembrane protein 53 n=1 Tax=Apostasia shenzhenica TaxID=1088818 RepID=A0A2I0A1A4_9ASPA|nr:hypothetical protein AXF42_Ash014220 [Apostasia shenzhenica]